MKRSSSHYSPVPDFDPHPLLKHPHLMTVLPGVWRRRDLLKGIPTEPRLFCVAPDSQILGYCHWQSHRERQPTVVLVHGLEGSSEAHYMRGLAHKLWRGGFNVIRLNQRNCGGTEHLSATLYHGALSNDIRMVLTELSSKDRLTRVWVVGYSLGGNLILKMAGEVGSNLPALQGVLAVCPNIEPAACVWSLEQPTNWIYHQFFVVRLKSRLQRKARLFPGKWDLAGLEGIRTLREFDQRYTAPDGGFDSADDYYNRAGARHVLGRIQVPTFIMTAQDDPIIPFSIFDLAAIRENPWITLWAPRHGGHCGFFQRGEEGEDRYWGENRLVEALISQTRRLESTGVTACS